MVRELCSVKSSSHFVLVLRQSQGVSGRAVTVGVVLPTVLQWCYNSVTLCYTGVTLCYSGVTLVLQGGVNSLQPETLIAQQSPPRHT